MRPFKTNGRHIPRYRGKVGQTVHIPSEKNGEWRTCETLGEIAVALALEFDGEVLRYETQNPIEYRLNNKKRTGFSDLCVWKRNRPSQHVEVRLDSALESDKAQAKLEAKRIAVEALGEGLAVVPRSVAVQEPYYSSHSYLYRFRRFAAEEASLSYLVNYVSKAYPESLLLGDLLGILQAASIPSATLYQALATNVLQFNWGAPLNEKTRVWRSRS